MAAQAPRSDRREAVPDFALADAIRALRVGRKPPLGDALGPVHVTLRRTGRQLATFWQRDGRLETALARAVFLAARQGANLLQVDIGERPHEVAADRPKRWFPDVVRGLIGIGIASGDGEVTWVAPSQMIAMNRGFMRVIELEMQRRGISLERFVQDGGRFFRFAARTVLIRLEPAVDALTLARAGPLVGVDGCTPDLVRQMIDGLARWMRCNLHANGRMTYKWWPSRGEESQADNTVRQFMATLCLIRLARRTGDPEDRRRAERNLDYNLQRFYRGHGPIGIIEFDGTAKLGAAALAALAILEAPSGKRYQAERERLEAGVLALRSGDGSFRTFHVPSERNDNQNFYPGEALLYLAERLHRSPDPHLLDQTLASVRWYRSWHLDQRNPALVPWHTQAAARLFELTGERWLRIWVFEMNDWLVRYQQWDEAPSPDLAGRFYDPARPEFGPPHASSTGVYLEGLARALRLAEAADDRDRARLYGRTIWRGLRNLRQLQFVDDGELYYVTRRERVRGGIRTEVYDNTIRVDNVQHALMALLELERLPAFRPAAAR